VNTDCFAAWRHPAGHAAIGNGEALAMPTIAARVRKSDMLMKGGCSECSIAVSEYLHDHDTLFATCVNLLKPLHTMTTHSCMVRVHTVLSPTACSTTPLCASDKSLIADVVAGGRTHVPPGQRESVLESGLKRCHERSHKIDKCTFQPLQFQKDVGLAS
jgi:hypothetical protein